MKLIIGLFTVLIAILIIASVSKNYLNTHPIPFLDKTPTMTINGQIFNLYAAKSKKEQEIGLSERTSLAQNYGMVFVFSKPGFYPFWMKNMKFPLDIIYINKNKVVEVFDNLQPPKTSSNAGGSLVIYKPREEADMVLEINAGLSQKYNIKKGDPIKTENL